MKFIRGGVLLTGLLGVASAAQAGVTSTWTITNDYDFRGNTQSAKDPAITGEHRLRARQRFLRRRVGQQHRFRRAGGRPLDDPGMEIDLYAGFTRTLEGSGLTYDVGIVGYAYPDESDFNYTEIYASLAKGWFKRQGVVLTEVRRQGGGRSRASARRQGRCRLRGTSKANATIPLPANFSLLGHVGYSTGDYWDNAFGDDQIDWCGRRRLHRRPLLAGSQVGRYGRRREGHVRCLQQRRPRDRDDCDYLPLERIRSSNQQPLNHLSIMNRACR